MVIFRVYLEAYEKVYKAALTSLMFATDDKLQLSTLTADFEHALLNTGRAKFPEAAAIGCPFHWKQALRRKMLELKIPKEVVHSLVEVQGCLIDVLTVIPEEEIITKGIPFIRANFDQRGNIDKFNSFWSYFVNTWMCTYPTSLWNSRTLPTPEIT